MKKFSILYWTVKQSQKFNLCLSVLESTLSVILGFLITSLGLRGSLSVGSYAQAVILSSVALFPALTVRQEKEWWQSHNSLVPPQLRHMPGCSLNWVIPFVVFCLYIYFFIYFCFHLQFNTQDYWYHRHEKTISFGTRTRPLMHNSQRR